VCASDEGETAAAIRGWFRVSTARAPLTSREGAAFPRRDGLPRYRRRVSLSIARAIVPPHRHCRHPRPKHPLGESAATAAQGWVAGHRIVAGWCGGGNGGILEIGYNIFPVPRRRIYRARRVGVRTGEWGTRARTDSSPPRREKGVAAAAGTPLDKTTPPASSCRVRSRRFSRSQRERPSAPSESCTHNVRPINKYCNIIVYVRTDFVQTKNFTTTTIVQ